jgi:uncharacterized protein (DUF1330 family)
MTVYIVVGFSVKDPQKLQQYSSAVPATLLNYNGEFVFKGSVVERLAGDFAFDYQAVIGFPSPEEALSWYDSEEYQSLIAVREEALDAQFQLIA